MVGTVQIVVGSTIQARVSISLERNACSDDDVHDDVVLAKDIFWSV